MAVAGRPPKGGVRTNAAGVMEVPDEPYTGPSPDLPRLPDGMQWPPQVLAWWDQIRVMPHCVLWTATDWLFAIDTAYMKADWWSEYFGGTVHATKSTEIRRREDQMGTTVEARRKLLIRYVEPGLPPVSTAAPSVNEGSSSITSIDDRRRRLAG